MEHDTISAPRWTKEEILNLFREGKTLDEVKVLTGLPGRVLGGYKGLAISQMRDSSQGGVVALAPPAQQVVTQPSPTYGHNGGDQGQAPPTLPPGIVEAPAVEMTAGPGEAQALMVLQGKPYLIRVQNVFVSPDALKCYQVLVARGFRGSVGDFFELCVLKTFKEIYGLVPAMMRSSEVQPS